MMKPHRRIHIASAKIFVPLAMAVLAITNAKANYQATVLADQPVGYWSLDLTDPQATNGIATDLTGNGNNGSYFNIYPGYNSVAGPSAFITDGVSLDGSTTYIDLSGGNTALNFGGQIAMEAWVQPSSSNAGGYVMGEGYDSAKNGDENEMRLNNGNFHSGTYNFSTGDAAVSGGVETTNWIHLVSTYDGTNWNLYQNGALVAQSADSVGALNFPDPWRIGDGTADGANRIMAGNLSQVALYNHALTPAQVLTHYFIGEYGTTNLSPMIVSQPASQPVPLGATVTLTCQTESVLPETNQWYFNGVPLAGQTSSRLLLSNVQTNNSGSYTLVSGNSLGSTNSAVANIVINPHLINWQSPLEISGASDVATNGTYFASWAPYNGGANSLPVNGVAFQGYSDLPSFNNSFPNGNGGPYFSSPNSANGNYNSLLQYATWANGQNATFSWGGMTPGHAYEVQIWVEDARNGSTSARWENFSGGPVGGTAFGTDTSSPVGYSTPLFSSPTGNPGNYIIGTFVADTTGAEEILATGFDGGGNPSAQVNLFQVRDVTPVTPALPVITQISLSGSTLVISGTNGTSGHTFAVLTSANLALPLSQWTSLSSGSFTGSNFSITNIVNPLLRQSFYTLQVQ
jgi:hypothetical protein